MSRGNLTIKCTRWSCRWQPTVVHFSAGCLFRQSSTWSPRSHQRGPLDPTRSSIRERQPRDLHRWPSSQPLSQRRGARTGRKKASVEDVVLEQGELPEPKPSLPVLEEPGTSKPSVILQARDHMLKYADCVLITRVGNFYEFYFEQARTWGSKLGLKVAHRRTSKKDNSKPVAMSGFPFFQLDRYLRILVLEHGQKVAIAEEVPNSPSQRAKAGGLMFDRQVKRVVTPGTLIDEAFLSPWSHNYLLSIIPQRVVGAKDTSAPGRDPDSESVGLAWIDLSTGDFFTQSIAASSVSSAVARISPREVLLDSQLEGTRSGPLAALIAELGQRATFYDSQKKGNDVEDLRREAADMNATGLSLVDDLTSLEAGAVSTLIDYVQSQLPGLRLRFLPLTQFKAKEHMQIDKHTLRGLEILQTMRDGVLTGSLLHSVRRTSTSSGARLLAERLVSPSTSRNEINRRLDLVDAFILHEYIRDDIIALLRDTTDSFRIVQSLACGKGDADSLLNLSRTIAITKQIADILSHTGSGESASPLHLLAGRVNLEGPTRLSDRITSAIDEDGLLASHQQEEEDAAEAASAARVAISGNDSEELASLNKRLKSPRFSRGGRAADEYLTFNGDIWVMRREANATLSRLHSELDSLGAEKEQLETSLRADFNASSLTLRMTPSLGHIVHVTGKDTKSTSISEHESARTVSASKSTRSLYMPEWTELGKRLEETKARIRGEEQQLFRELREGVCEEIAALRWNASIMDELDVACSSAILALARNLVRPVIADEPLMAVVGGRHMAVEAGLENSGRSFTPNDCVLGGSVGSAATGATENIQLITGPNMAGKSTYLRQVAIMAVLAQAGLFVPATHATIGIVDALFSRIGAADDLFNDQSTFMVEMVETAAILKGATERSLVVMDEVGRGTTPEDGIAVGFAVLDSLRAKRVARVLFATHFHRLTDPDMCATWPEVGCWSTRAVDEQTSSGSNFRFVHKMARGVNRESHALKVAKLAGLPGETIEVAARVLRDKL